MRKRMIILLYSDSSILLEELDEGVWLFLALTPHPNEW